MARMDDLIPFAQKHRLKIGTIRDLIAYRRRYDHLVQKRSEVQFTSRWGGDWTAMTFFNKATGTEQIALQKGRISLDTPTLVRMHQFSPFTDLLGQAGPRSKLLSRSMEIIGEAGSGVVVLLHRHTPDAFTRMFRSSEERRVGTACVSMCRSRGARSF